MSEGKPEYIVEAMNLLMGEPSVEIAPAQTTIVRSDGELQEVERAAFVKLSTSFKNELKDISGDALKVWLFVSLSINRKTEQAHPGLRTISESVGLAVNTVRKAISELEKSKLLTVKRGITKYNIYEVPEYVSANRQNPTVSNRDTVEETVSNRDTTVSNFVETVSPSVILNQRNQKNQKRGDLFDGMLHYGKQALDRKEDKIEEIIQTLERSLKINVARTTRNQAVARRLLNDGRSIGTWLEWVTRDEWRASHLYLYADMERIWTEFPQAFGADEGKNPQGLEIGL